MQFGANFKVNRVHVHVVIGRLRFTTVENIQYKHTVESYTLLNHNSPMYNTNNTNKQTTQTAPPGEHLIAVGLSLLIQERVL